MRRVTRAVAAGSGAPTLLLMVHPLPALSALPWLERAAADAPRFADDAPSLPTARAVRLDARAVEALRDMARVIAAALASGAPDLERLASSLATAQVSIADAIARSDIADPRAGSRMIGDALIVLHGIDQLTQGAIRDERALSRTFDALARILEAVEPSAPSSSPLASAPLLWAELRNLVEIARGAPVWIFGASVAELTATSERLTRLSGACAAAIDELVARFTRGELTAGALDLNLALARATGTLKTLGSAVELVTRVLLLGAERLESLRAPAADSALRALVDAADAVDDALGVLTPR